MDLLHTEVADEYGGRGLATELIRATLDDARTRGRHVLPYCPFVKGFLAKNPDYADLVPIEQRSRFGLAI
jgi:predicted GNAT family acetyltransferase